MARSSVAIVSRSESARVFELAGIDCYVIDEGEEEQLRALLASYDVVIVDEDLEEHVREGLKRESREGRPLLVVLPSFTRMRSSRLERLRDMVSRSLGVRLKWER